MDDVVVVHWLPVTSCQASGACYVSTYWSTNATRVGLKTYHMHSSLQEDILRQSAAESKLNRFEESTRSVTVPTRPPLAVVRRSYERLHMRPTA